MSGSTKTNCSVDEAQFQGLKNFLNSLPKRLRENGLRAGMRMTVNILKAEAKKTVPVRSGALQKSLTVKVSSGTRIIGYVGVYRGNEIKVHRESENSAAGYFAKKMGARGTAYKTISKKPWLYAVQIEKRESFLKNAFDNKRDEVIATFEQNIRKGVEESAAKMLKKLGSLR